MQKTDERIDVRICEMRCDEEEVKRCHYHNGKFFMRGLFISLPRRYFILLSAQDDEF